MKKLISFRTLKSSCEYVNYCQSETVIQNVDAFCRHENSGDNIYLKCCAKNCPIWKKLESHKDFIAKQLRDALIESEKTLKELNKT